MGWYNIENGHIAFLMWTGPHLVVGRKACRRLAAACGKEPWSHEATLATNQKPACIARRCRTIGFNDILWWKIWTRNKKVAFVTSKMNFQTVPLTVWAVKQVQDISFVSILWLNELNWKNGCCMHMQKQWVHHLGICSLGPTNGVYKCLPFSPKLAMMLSGITRVLCKSWMWKPLKTLICFHVFVPLLFLHMWLATCFEQQNKPKDCHSILLSRLLVRKFQSNKLVTHAICFLSFNFCLSYEPQQKNLDPSWQFRVWPVRFISKTAPPHKNVAVVALNFVPTIMSSFEVQLLLPNPVGKN